MRKPSIKKNTTINEGNFRIIAELLHATLDTQTAPLMAKKNMHDEIARAKEIQVAKKELEKIKVWAAKVSEKVGIKYR